MMTKILLVEDEESIRGFLKINLKRNGYEFIEVDNGEDGIKIAINEKPAIVILDVMLPGIDGFNVCKRIREEEKNIGIIMLTAKSQDIDKITGLEYGADDYITKPFSLPILIRKIAVLLRRSKVQKKVQEMSEIIHYQNITLDVDAYKAYINNTLIELTPREFEILQELVTHPGKILSRQYLLSRIWKYDYFGDERVIDTHIKNLRKKLNNADYIETIRGVGYRIDKEDKK